jgi:F0F1-type ATP synthase membrane subunit b/b'
MSEKSLDEKVEKLESAVDPNTVISVGGYSFTPAKLMIAGGILSSILGGLYGAFEIYKDYQNMKEAIQTYVAPDLSAINERLSVMEKDVNLTKRSVDEATGYANEIRNDLKRDIRRIEGVVDNVERNTKDIQRETTKDIKDMRTELREVRREVEVNINSVRKEVDDKIKKALDNPLAN